MKTNDLDVLIRKIDPRQFSPTAHGAGYHLVHTAGPNDAPGDAIVRPYESGIFKNLFSRGRQTHYFVKRLDRPLVVSSWTHHWSEGTSAISLDFASTFELQANETAEARKLVAALHHSESASTALHGLINGCLHKALTREFNECAKANKNVLTRFRNSDVGIGESTELNDEVSQAVATELGGIPFRIGLRLKNAPPMQIEVRAVNEFTLADSDKVRTVNTVALLELDNYQIHKKSGVETEAAIRATIEGSITQAVRSLLFAKKYYSIVESFNDEKSSVQAQMRAVIAANAQQLGYALRMFQTFPNIAALELLDSLRIDMDGRDSPEAQAGTLSKYYPKDSTGYVHMEISFSVKARDFRRLHRLINPNVTDVKAPIMDRVRQICQDEIQKINRKEFNLHFQDVIVQRLSNAIVKDLGGDGLEAEIIKINQIATEEASRYKAICGRTTPFAVSISAHADRGMADSVYVQGTIEVTGIAEGGWEKFERKDFGFRRDSSWDPAQLRRHAEARRLPISTEATLSDAERHSVAIELELLEIRDRVASTLREQMAKVSELAVTWSTLDNSKELRQWAQRIAAEAISNEFGLSVALWGVERSDTATETTQSAIRTNQHGLLRETAAVDVGFELSKRKSEGEARLQVSKELHERDLSIIGSDPENELPEHLANMSKDRDGTFEKNRVTLQNATQTLTPKTTSHQRLPWEKSPGARSDDDQSPSG